MAESINPIPEEPPEPLCFSIDLQPVEDLVPEHDPSPGVISVDPFNANMRRSWELPVHISSTSESINPIPEVPPEPLRFSIDLQPVEDLVPEHDRSPGVISVDLFNAKDILPRIPAAVPTRKLGLPDSEIKKLYVLTRSHHTAADNNPSGSI